MRRLLLAALIVCASCTVGNLRYIYADLWGPLDEVSASFIVYRGEPDSVRAFEVNGQEYVSMTWPEHRVVFRREDREGVEGWTVSKEVILDTAA